MDQILLRPLADAFLQVGVFVALLVVPLGWARVRWGHRFEAALQRHRRLGPVVGALLTAPPGCGGAIVVVGAYSRGAVSYGGAVAALVATSGDAAWVLLAADPLLALELKVLLVVTGAVSGSAVDAVGLAPARRCERAVARQPVLVGGGGAPAAPSAPVDPGPPATLGTFGLVLWVTLGCGLLVSLPVTFQLLELRAVGGVDPYLALGVLGALLCLGGFVAGRGRLADDSPEDAHPTSMTAVLRHGAHEVAFITTWVAAACVGWEATSRGLGLDVAALPLAGAVGVLVGAAVGLVPGCALQIAFVGVYLAGGMPLPTLAANSLSQDGDALIPLLALEQRPALLAAALTSVPAVLVGLALLLLT